MGCVKQVKAVDPPFLNQYILLLEDMYEYEYIYIHTHTQIHTDIHTHFTHWLMSQDDTQTTPHGSMSIPSSFLIIPTYRKSQQRVSPSHTIQFNLSDHISLILHNLY